MNTFNIFSKKTKHIYPIEPQILIFTGAGLSEESGIPTFRTGNDGLWNNYNIDEVCNAKNFLLNKEKVFEFYNARKKEYINSKPNNGHKAIADIQNQYGKENVRIYTSNIDNLLEDAGCTDVQHIHGHIHHMNCLNCSHHWDIGLKEFKINTHCPNCNLYKKTKPGVIFFHEKAPMYPQLLSDFGKGNIYKNGHFTPIIKIVIGSSLQVISQDDLQVNRGISILLDPFPLQNNKFKDVIEKKATEGVEDLKLLIKKYYV